MAQRLGTQLRRYGCQRTPQEFKEILAKTKQELFPGMTEERLACADEESVTYCEEVSKRVGVPLPRPFVKFQLLAHHK
jgi:hypothetical protein